jgi:two-component system nitrate/nitrite response regulator NarL
MCSAVADMPIMHVKTRPIRILVADDHEVMRMGIRNLLESVPNWRVSAEAGTGREAVEMALETPPDVIIMDITMPEMNGIEAAATIAERNPSIPIIMFSLHLSQDVVGRFKSGAIRGAVSKNEAARDLVEAVKRVVEGGTFFPPRSGNGPVAN